MVFIQLVVQINFFLFPSLVLHTSSTQPIQHDGDEVILPILENIGAEYRYASLIETNVWGTCFWTGNLHRGAARTNTSAD